MHAHLRSARIAPKKANLVAALVRRMRVEKALAFLNRVPKKGARILHDLIASAIANAEHGAAQDRRNLVVKSLVVQKGPAFRRFIPMARGRSRPIDKWTSHISVELGVLLPDGAAPASAQPSPEKPRAAKPAGAPSDAAVTHATHAPEVQHPASAPHVPEKRGKAPGPGKGPATSGPTFQPHRRGGRGS